MWTRRRQRRVYKVVVRQRIVERILEIQNRSILNKEIKKERAHRTMNHNQVRNKRRRQMQVVVAGYLVICLDLIKSREEEHIMITTTTISMILMILKALENQIRKVINTRMR